MSSYSLDRPYFIGIGGSGMGVLAAIMAESGALVSGSDASSGPRTAELTKRGVRVFYGHDVAHISGSDPSVVVVSLTAIASSNPELEWAREQGVPVITRSQLLAQLTDTAVGIAVAGTHGKTSTTAMIVAIFQAAGRNPSYALGGDIQVGEALSGGHYGSDPEFIFEADESDGSLTEYTPRILVITNIDPDHLDYYQTVDSYLQVYSASASALGRGSTLIVCVDDVHLRALVEKMRGELAERGVRIITYTADVANDAEVEARIISYDLAGDTARVVVKIYGREVSFAWHTPGIHMAGNALAALMVAKIVGIDLDQAAKGIEQYHGVARRFQLRHTISGVHIYDDYAHHPTEVAAVIAAAQAIAQGRVGVIFQPHMFSRTAQFAQRFATELGKADKAWLLDIYPARETPIPGLSSQVIADFNPTKVQYTATKELTLNEVVRWARPGDIIITMGAGDVTLLPDELAALMSEKR